MKTAIEAIMGRRSIRAYKPQQITDAEVETIIDAGRYAPSAMNTQPWHFTVIRNKSIIDNLSDRTKQHILNKLEDKDDERAKRFSDPATHIFHNAPTIIVVSGDKDKSWAITDCGAASENMLVAAEALSIGSCWIGFIGQLFESDELPEVMKILELDDSLKPFYALAFGYKQSEDALPPERREGTVNYIR